MKRGISIFAAVLASSVSAEAPKQSADDTVLRACLPRNAGVLAGRRLTGGSGFDFRVAQEIAAAMGKTFEAVWYENELDEESNPLSETYAMLSYGLCDIVPGHPRFENTVGVPGYERAVLPRWLGMPREISQETGMLSQRLVGYVDVAPITVSDGYMRTQIGLIYRAGRDEPQNLAAIEGQRLAVQENTLSGTIAMLATRPGDRGNLVTLTPGADFLWEVEKAGLDLAITDVVAFDTFLKANPFTELRLAEWRHPIGIDIGIAVAEDFEYLPKVNTAISELISSGQLENLAAEEGLTFSGPMDRELSPKITMQMLMTD